MVWKYLRRLYYYYYKYSVVLRVLGRGWLFRSTTFVIGHFITSVWRRIWFTTNKERREEMTTEYSLFHSYTICIYFTYDLYLSGHSLLRRNITCCCKYCITSIVFILNLQVIKGRPWIFLRRLGTHAKLMLIRKKKKIRCQYKNKSISASRGHLTGCDTQKLN